MKTVISLPEAVFEEVDRAARRTGRSRSELCVIAIRDYLDRHDEDHVTAALDAVYASEDARADRFLTRAARRTLARNTW
jgi:metal-responsive CopG/Arc/MetJ family transcriptional regulator